MDAAQIERFKSLGERARTIETEFQGVRYTLVLPTEVEFGRAFEGSQKIVDQLPLAVRCTREWVGIDLSHFDENMKAGTPAPCLPELVAIWLEDDFEALAHLVNLIVAKHLERRLAKEAARKNS